MAAPAAKPITVTQIDSVDYEGPTPAPFVVVGEIPIEALEQADAEFTAQEAPVIDDTPADAAAVAADLQAVVDALVAGGFLTEA